MTHCVDSPAAQLVASGPYDRNEPYMDPEAIKTILDGINAELKEARKMMRHDDLEGAYGKARSAHSKCKLMIDTGVGVAREGVDVWQNPYAHVETLKEMCEDFKKCILGMLTNHTVEQIEALADVEEYRHSVLQDQSSVDALGGLLAGESERAVHTPRPLSGTGDTPQTPYRRPEENPRDSQMNP